MPVSDPVSVARQYEALIRAEGPAGLQFINARVPHRFTFVFRLKDAVLRKIFEFDKQGESGQMLFSHIALHESFCQYALEEGEFVTNDSANSSRLDGHKYQGMVGAYAGVPLLNRWGVSLGAICHLDFEPQVISTLELDILHRVAEILPAYLDPAPAAADHLL